MAPDARFRLPARPKADPASIVSGPHWRITVLNERLLRLEWSDDDRFEDRPTQVVLNREFPVVDFTATPRRGGVQIETAALHLDYDGQPFSPGGLSVRRRGAAGWRTVWHYGAPQPVGLPSEDNLGGTARTLDEVDGATPLEPGVVSVLGWATLDDSASLALTDDGWVDQRVGDVDLYLFLHGDDAAGAVRDFYALTGPQPMLPRWALGNWWSRYHPYTGDEYVALVDRFGEERLPFSVAVADMDWHWVDLPAEWGSGWTGFSWNTDLFPDPRAFAAALHDRGLKLSLNLHPADGVRAFEDAYPRLARRLGVDPASKTPLPFDVDDPDYVTAYLEEVLHPLEDDGVDFWWLDWQQGSSSSIPGLDPLWLLNHVHYLDSGRDGRRPMTFSRYAGPGSHRYPVGFSGDTVTSWASLHFQPYFTATAANIGYGWWSHDIGGHMFGHRDEEMVARWFQFGVFSPINRLHSTASPFMGKEPWNFTVPYSDVMADALRLRHRLVPYLYTMNERAHRLSEPLVRPLYHVDPRPETLQHSLTSYVFGTELLVAPATAPLSVRTRRSAVTTWLPHGRWTDWFTGVSYTGGRFVTLHRTLHEYPVLAKAGAIVPMVGGEDLGVGNPRHLHLRVFAGADGTFALYEDDDALEPRSATTRLAWDDAAGVLTVGPAEGDATVVPATRAVTVSITGIGLNAAVDLPSSWEHGTLTVDVGDVAADAGVTVRLVDPPAPADPRLDDRLFDLVHSLQTDYIEKHRLWEFLQTTPTIPGRVAGLPGLEVSPDVRAVVEELLLAHLVEEV